MTTHSELTRHHRPPHVLRRRIIWAPTFLVGALLFALAPHTDLAIVGAGAALLGAAGWIAEAEEV